MSLKNSIVSVVTAATLAAGTLTSVSTAASADGWRHHDGHHNGGSYSSYRPHNNYYAVQPRGDRDYDGGHEYHHHRNHEGRALAAGAFAVILGIALASQAAHVQHDYYDEN